MDSAGDVQIQHDARKDPPLNCIAAALRVKRLESPARHLRAKLRPLKHGKWEIY